MALNTTHTLFIKLLYSLSSFSCYPFLVGLVMFSVPENRSLVVKDLYQRYALVEMTMVTCRMRLFTPDGHDNMRTFCY